MERAARTRGNNFGSANATPTTQSPDSALLTPTAIKQLDTHFNNLAARLGNTAMEQLIAPNAALANTIADNISIKSLLLELKSGVKAQDLSAAESSNMSSADACAKEVARLHLAIRKCWVPGKFYSMHGYGVGSNHNSAMCKHKGLGHVNTATKKNPAGSGKNIYKDWDYFLKSGS